MVCVKGILLILRRLRGISSSSKASEKGIFFSYFCFNDTSLCRCAALHRPWLRLTQLKNIPFPLASGYIIRPIAKSTLYCNSKTGLIVMILFFYLSVEYTIMTNGSFSVSSGVAFGLRAIWVLLRLWISVKSVGTSVLGIM